MASSLQMNATATRKSAEPIIPFPEESVVAALNKWWDSEVVEQADDPLNPAVKVGTLYDLLPTIDSLTVVRGLLTIEEIINMTVPVRLVKRGGYSSRKQMIDHLLPRIRELYQST
jgi:hypothetical protein